MLQGMAGSVVGVWVAHGEGKCLFPDADVERAVLEGNLAPIRYSDARGCATEEYPANPNGSPHGIAALCSANGRHLAMMPHPERCVCAPCRAGLLLLLAAAGGGAVVHSTMGACRSHFACPEGPFRRKVKEGGLVTNVHTAFLPLRALHACVTQLLTRHVATRVHARSTQGLPKRVFVRSGTFK